MSIRSTEQLFLERPSYSCFLHNGIMITYPISNNFCLKTFLWDVISFTIFLLFRICVSSFIVLLLFLFFYLIISFQQNNEIKKGKTLIELKHLLFCSSVDLFHVRDFKRSLTDGNLIRKCV